MSLAPMLYRDKWTDKDGVTRMTDGEYDEDDEDYEPEQDEDEETDWNKKRDFKT